MKAKKRKRKLKELTEEELTEVDYKPVKRARYVCTTSLVRNFVQCYYVINMMYHCSSKKCLDNFFIIIISNTVLLFLIILFRIL